MSASPPPYSRPNLAERYVRRAERKAAVPGGFPRPGQTVAEHEAEVAAYWGVSRSRDNRQPLTSGQHILHLLLTVLTFGLWLPVWVIRAWRGNRPYVPPGSAAGGAWPGDGEAPAVKAR